ncbi:MAG: ribosomal protein S18 [bacterium]|nr:MAG: ribosomal protein S18 [bacterium]
MMNRSGGNQRADKGKGGGPGKKYSRKRKVCHFCSDRIDYIDYKDEKLLRSYIPERGKILPRRISGVCAIHQRKLMEAVKRARNIAILPYTTL